MHYQKGNDESTSKFLKGRDGIAPRPPKKGEILMCLICGQPMPPDSFSKIASVRKREFKWQCHEQCMNGMFDACDRETPGLISERKE